jgi:hypothetical protein
MNTKNFLPKLLILFIAGFGPFLIAQKPNTAPPSDKMVSSIIAFVKSTAPMMSEAYVSGDDGKDVLFSDYMLKEIAEAKSKGDDQYRATALCTFSAIIAMMSKNDAKSFGEENGDVDILMEEYQHYLFLEPADPLTPEAFTDVYLSTIHSVLFHLKVRKVPFYENLDDIVYFISEEMNKATTSYEPPVAFKINQLHCAQLYSIVLEGFAKYLVAGMLNEKITGYPFTELALKRRDAIPAVDEFSQLNAKMSQLSREGYAASLQKTNETIAGYFTIINESLTTILTGGN